MNPSRPVNTGEKESLKCIIEFATESVIHKITRTIHSQSLENFGLYS